MAEIFDPRIFHVEWLSLPFVLATVSLIGFGLHVMLIDGARILRASFLMICSGLLPAAGTYMLVGSLGDNAMARDLYRMGFALLPTTVAGVVVFECVLASEVERHRWWLIGSAAIALALSGLILGSDRFIAGAWRTSLGFAQPEAGPLMPLVLVVCAGWMGWTARFLIRQRRTEQATRRRRQLRSSLLGVVALTLCGLDAPLLYGVGWFPVFWLLGPVAAFMFLRSLAGDSRIDGASMDRRAPLALAYIAAAGAGVWMVWRLASGSSLVALVCLTMTVYVTLRIVIALVRAISYPQATSTGTPLERMLHQYNSRVQELHDEYEIGRATMETLALGLGCTYSDLLLTSGKDWGWETYEGEAMPEEALPDPMTYNWLLDHGQPLQRIELQGVRVGDLRGPVEQLFDANEADIIVPLVNRDEMVGMLCVSMVESGRPLNREELGFLGKVAEYLSDALVYARIHREVNTQVAAQKELELAAAVQSAFVPCGELVEHGRVAITGLWEPATQCGGDWWSLHPLSDGRVLVLIGDVTGHGVAAAMITAAAKGCYDVAEKLMGNDLDLARLLELLDTTVRLVGGGYLHMTCFATLLDPEGGTVAFANAGHAIPYICRPRPGGGIQLGALVARGNPLGANDAPVYQARSRDLQSGDTLVWFTDGIVECTDPERREFGDRRLQRLLRKLDRLEPSPRAVRDQIVRAVIAFRKDQPSDDDITLVVARVT